jgi:hypothetical protein
MASQNNVDLAISASNEPAAEPPAFSSIDLTELKHAWIMAVFGLGEASWL